MNLWKLLVGPLEMEGPVTRIAIVIEIMIGIEIAIAIAIGK